MLLDKVEYTKYDHEAIKILDDFIPDKICDAHAHFFDSDYLPKSHNHPVRTITNMKSYKEAMVPILGNNKTIRANVIPFPDATMGDYGSGNLLKSDAYVSELIKENPENVYEIMVHPKESAEKIEKRLFSPRIRGLKCYYLLSDKPNCAQLPIGDYLSEGAWEVAQKHRLCITLHLVKDEALSAPENLSYIKEMSKRYPDATLILAHCARAFAQWTGFEAVSEIAHLENVWYDFSAICESPVMYEILRKVGVDRCMWGSDFPVCLIRGRAISVGKGFYWLGENEKENIPNQWTVGIENLFAVRQACKMLDFSPNQIEKFFWGSANNLWNFK